MCLTLSDLDRASRISSLYSLQIAFFNLHISRAPRFPSVTFCTLRCVHIASHSLSRSSPSHDSLPSIRALLHRLLSGFPMVFDIAHILASVILHFIDYILLSNIIIHRGVPLADT